MENLLMPLRLHLAAAAALLALSAFAARADDMAADPALFNPLAALGEDRLKAFAERPLFTPSRRAPELAVEAPPPDPEPDQPPEPAGPDTASPPNAKLLGILGSDTGAIAVIQDQDAGQTLVLHVGDSIGDWQVAEIGEISVTLSLEDQTTDLQLFQPGGAPTGDAGATDAGAGDGADPAAGGADASSDNSQDDPSADPPDGQDPRTMMDRIRALRDSQQKAGGGLFGHKPQKPGHHPPGFDPAQ